MSPYAVLTNRKRAIIALIHSVVFLLLALRSLAAPSPMRGLHAALQFHTQVAGSVALTSIYVIVTAILVTLLAISRGLREKLYFGFCSVSAASGLLRCLVGDPPFHSANLIRVAMLSSAVVVGTLIWRGYTVTELRGEAD